MNLQAMYELRDRLKTLVIAGSSLLSDDFRLQRAVEGFAPLAGAAPVFAQIHALATKLLTAKKEEQNDLLLDCLILLDAVITTQAKNASSGDSAEIHLPTKTEWISSAPEKAKTDIYAKLSYKRFSPLITALETKGSGRYETIRSIHEQDPEVFQDFRIKPKLVSALGDSYSEIADMAVKWLSQDDASLLPLLLENFNVQGNKEMVRRIEVMQAIDRGELTEFFKKAVEEGNTEIKIAAIQALAKDPTQTDYFLALLASEKGRVKDTLLRILAKSDKDEILSIWEKQLTKNPSKAAELLPYSLSKSITALLNRILRQEISAFEALLANAAETKQKKDAARAALIQLAYKLENCADAESLESIARFIPLLPEHGAQILMRICLSTKDAHALAQAKDLLKSHKSVEAVWCAFVATLLSETANAAYEKFHIYLKNDGLLSGILGGKKNAAQRESFVKNFTSIYAKDGEYYIRFTHPTDGPYGTSESVKLYEPLDIRFISDIVQADLGNEGKRFIRNNTKELILQRLLTDDPKVKQIIGTFIYQTAQEQMLDADMAKLLKRCNWTEYEKVLWGCIKHLKNKKSLANYELFYIHRGLESLDVDTKKLADILDSAADALEGANDKVSKLFRCAAEELRGGIAISDVSWQI